MVIPDVPRTRAVPGTATMGGTPRLKAVHVTKIPPAMAADGPGGGSAGAGRVVPACGRAQAGCSRRSPAHSVWKTPPVSTRR